MSNAAKLPPTSDQIRSVVREVCAGRGVARLDLFGSVARNEGTPGSYIDLLVDFAPGSNPGLFEMGELKEDLEDRLGCAVERSRNPIRRNAVLTRTIPLYVRG